MFEQDHPWHMNKEEDHVQTLEFGAEDLDTLIAILQKAKEINPLSWATYKKQLEKGE